MRHDPLEVILVKFGWILILVTAISAVAAYLTGA